MISTHIKLTPISVEEMLNDNDSASYNPSTWKESVMRYAKFPKCQFYIQPKDEHFSFNRFYVSYVADGIYFFATWSAFSSCIKSHPFVQAFIIEGVLYKQLFKFSDDTYGGISNTKAGRQFIRKNTTTKNIMVSSCI